MSVYNFYIWIHERGSILIWDCFGGKKRNAYDCSSILNINKYSNSDISLNFIELVLLKIDLSYYDKGILYKLCHTLIFILEQSCN